MLKFVSEEPCSQSRAADNNIDYTYFQKHLRLISLPVHSSVPLPLRFSRLYGNVCSIVGILKKEKTFVQSGIVECRNGQMFLS